MWATQFLARLCPPGRDQAPAHLPKNASGVTSLALPAASIFTIDKQAEKFVSVHNMFDIAKVYAAVQWST